MLFDNMLTEGEYIKLFCDVDDFCKGFEPQYKKTLIGDGAIKRDRKTMLTLSEIITILVSYHASGMSCFKYYYNYLQNERIDLFGKLPHYDSYIRLIKRAFFALINLLQSIFGKVTEYTFIDSTPITVCKNTREKRHRVFKGLAAKGKTSTGWFFGFKLHTIFNEHREIIRISITPGNTDDRKPVPTLLKNIQTRLIGDKGYISKKLFNQLFENGVTLITKVKKNMKNVLMGIKDKLMLQKRKVIETIFSSIKSLGTFVHHRHRSPINAFAHLLAGLINYQFKADKSSFLVDSILKA